MTMTDGLKGGDEIIGSVDIPLSTAIEYEEPDAWYEITGKGKDGMNTTTGEIRLKLVFS